MSVRRAARTSWILAGVAWAACIALLALTLVDGGGKPVRLLLMVMLSAVAATLTVIAAGMSMLPPVAAAWLLGYKAGTDDRVQDRPLLSLVHDA